MQIRIDVYDADGNKLGEGPIRTATAISITRSLDGAGSITIKCPARDARARELLTNEARVRVYVDEFGRGLREVGRGIIREVGYSATGSGAWELTASGPDILDELKRRNVKFGRSYVATPLNQIVQDLIGLVPGWSARCEIEDLYTGRFDATTVLKALQALTQYQGLHLRLALGEETNIIEVGAFGDDAGLRLVNPDRLPADLHENLQVGVIASMKRTASSSAVANRLYALGAGQNVDAALDLGAATRSTPPVISEAVNDRVMYYIEDAESIEQYGLIEHVGQFKEIASLGNSETLLTLAANALHDAAAAWLRRYAVAQESYLVTVLGVNRPLAQGDRVTVDYIDVIEDQGDLIETLRVRGDFWVMRATESFGSVGSSQMLELSDIDRYEETTARVIVGALEQIRIQGMAVQPSFNHYTYGPEQLNVDATNAGTCQLIITDKTYQVVQVMMRVRSRPFTSTAKGAQSTTAAGGGDHNHRMFVLTSISGFPGVSPRPFWGRDASGGAFHGVRLETALNADIWTEGASGDHTHTIPAANLIYGIYKDTLRPAGMTITVNGLSVETGVGVTGSDLDVTYDITAQVLARSGGFRGVHNVVITPASGQGEVLVTFDVYELITPNLFRG